MWRRADLRWMAVPGTLRSERAVRVQRRLSLLATQAGQASRLSSGMGGVLIVSAHPSRLVLKVEAVGR